MKKFTRFMSLMLILATILSFSSVGALASSQDIGSEAVDFTLADAVWDTLETAEDAPSAADKMRASAMASSNASEYGDMKGGESLNADRIAKMLAAYRTATTSKDVVRSSVMWNSKMTGFTFTTKDGVNCLYDAQLRTYGSEDVKSVQSSYYSNANAANGYTQKTYGNSGKKVYLIAPYYATPGEAEKFNTGYVDMASKVAEKLNGTLHIMANSYATGPNVAKAMENGDVVFFDSHGVCTYTNSGEKSSFLCLTTTSGITYDDLNVVWYTGGSCAIDGRYITSKMTKSAPNSFVWMGICQGMMSSGLCNPLRNKGVGVVYGYSQNVSFKGDYELLDVFWKEMLKGSEVKDAFKNMQDTTCRNGSSYSYSYYGYRDGQEPYGNAFPIIASEQDQYPTYADRKITAKSTWKLPIGAATPTTPTEPTTPTKPTTPTEPTTPDGSLNEVDAALNVAGGNIRFTNDSIYPWTVNANGSAQSGNSRKSYSTSAITTKIVVTEAQKVLEFKWGISPERAYSGDKGILVVNGKTEATLSTNYTSGTSWQDVSITLPRGEYEIKWVYEKGYSYSSYYYYSNGLDKLFLDDVSLQ